MAAKAEAVPGVGVKAVMGSKEAEEKRVVPMEEQGVGTAQGVDR